MKIQTLQTVTANNGRFVGFIEGETPQIRNEKIQILKVRKYKKPIKYRIAKEKK